VSVGGVVPVALAEAVAEDVGGRTVSLGVGESGGAEAL
jgi:hypothetical protein